MTVSECCLIKLLPYILYEKYIIYVLASEMASPGNRGTVPVVSASTLSIPTPHCGPGIYADRSPRAADSVDRSAPPPPPPQQQQQQQQQQRQHRECLLLGDASFVSSACAGRAFCAPVECCHTARRVE